MDMVRQDANGIRYKRLLCLDHPIDIPESFYLVNEQITRSVREGDREEEEPAFDICTPISGHGENMPHEAGVGKGGLRGREVNAQTSGVCAQAVATSEIGRRGQNRSGSSCERRLHSRRFCPPYAASPTPNSHPQFSGLLSCPEGI